ncbi:type II toxin-antitoxin system ParD family antitoxin [Rhizobium sp. CRIBSB]|nr:type II toxin-antitoxin system ParD family antitoxin [Rhizobium sp. CRIBSB]
MSTITIAITDAMKEWIDAKAQSGDFQGPADYVVDLIRREQERANKITLMQALVDEGLASGIGHRSKQELLEAALTNVRARREG